MIGWRPASAVLALALTAALAAPPYSSSAVLSQLPDGEEKRQFIIDCTNCHQFSERHAYADGQPRTREQWVAIVTRMINMAGANTGFPIMSGGRRAEPTAEWLARYLTAPPTSDAARLGPPHEWVARPDVVEYLLPVANDLAHDVAIDSSGSVIVTGMFTSAMYTLDTVSSRFTPTIVPIPVEKANPRAVEIAANGDWWVLLGGPGKLARYRPAQMRWDTFDIGLYGHSVALGADGRAWFNGHFTRNPELIGYVDPATGRTDSIPLPLHPTMAEVPGGPIPYELRIGRDGVVWMSELQGHRMISYDPATRRSRVYALPTSISAPRRFDIDADGMLWIPNYGANSLARLDPASGDVREIPLPRRDAVPYVARTHRGSVWIGTNASDEVYRYDIATGRFRVYPLPTPGAVIRHLVVSPRNGDVWLAYGGSPGIPARIARLRP